MCGSDFKEDLDVLQLFLRKISFFSGIGGANLTSSNKWGKMNFNAKQLSICDCIVEVL